MKKEYITPSIEKMFVPKTNILAGSGNISDEKGHGVAETGAMRSIQSSPLPQTAGFPL